MLKMSGCAFSILVKKNDGIRPVPDKLGQLSSLFVPDITRRRADYFGHAVPFHIFGHIYSYQGLFVIEHKLRHGFGQLGLATPVGPRNMNEPIGLSS